MAKSKPASLLQIRLADGTPAIVRPLRPDEGNKLADGMRRLSSDSRRKRFLSAKSHLSRRELEFLTCCDQINHLAIGLVITDEDGRELQSVAVARCIRDAGDQALGDVAIVVADEWQRRGVGKILIDHLARLSWDAGMRRWRAHFFADNVAPRRLMERIGKKIDEQLEGAGVVKVVFELLHFKS